MVGGAQPTQARRLELLLARIAEGDQASLEDFYGETCRRVLGLVTRILGDRQRAEEATLDVYAQVWQKASSFRSSRGRPMTWVLTMARNRAVDLLRASAAEGTRRDLLDYAEELRDERAGPEERTIWGERATAVREALGRLAEDQRLLITAAFFRGRTHQELADVLGMPLGTVKTKIRRGLMELRAQLTKDRTVDEVEP